MNSDVDMNNKAIINVDNIKTDNIFENTTLNGITIHNETSMSNNKIINLAAPTSNSDAATKQYVDNTAGSSGVQNPMVANLDGGLFNISNTQTITSQTLQNTDGGNIFSKGTFQHGGLSIGDFGVGGQTITFAPATSWKIKNFGLSTTYFEYDQATQKLTTENGATQEIANGAIMSAVSGGKITLTSGGTLQLYLNPNVANQNEELSLLDINSGENQILQTQGNSNSVPNIPQSLNPIVIINLNCDDVSAYVPYTNR
jgi:hypothetical protein